MDTQTARGWVDRWDRQQERYIADREERFTVIGDVVAAVTADAAEPLVLDLGCGPGSLATRVAARLPKARVVGVDQDPVLLALARAGYGDTVRFVDGDLAAAGWSGGLDLPGPVDVAVSTTALHWLPENRLGAVYEEVFALLRPGGVLVNGDNLYDAQPTVAKLETAVLDARAERVGVTDNEEWTSWWDAAAAEPQLAEAFAERARRGPRHGITEWGVGPHEQLLRDAGFSEVGTVWRSGNDVVLVAVR
ncbi:class I SAM-dependent methyltransferase [Actinokineospora bangkokensis]|uniref:Methyltransferase n=1 Tax=Actinokineospora bangkokensis TaxID=1193682 RepID=A0A1Q9LKF3_9PSEU|nr:class I SAM-dependent methyltransferase [Actinokineospora bangkokensis]OLR92512.1 methyltransferase [Actinokineospora bangkokensis]